MAITGGSGQRPGFLWSAEVLKQGKELRIPGEGSSMTPLIRAGDLMRIQPASAAEVHCGDIVVFLRNGRLMAHRVMEIRHFGRRLELLTKGDANLDNDPPLEGDAVLGMVAAVEGENWELRLDGAFKRRLHCLAGWLSNRFRGRSIQLAELLVRLLRLQRRGPRTL
jgi:hypothetical protein